MTFQIRTERRATSVSGDDRIWILDDDHGCILKVAPALGFNAYQWRVPQGELLFATAEFFQDSKPTRSGFPILFPFPNRIRDGRFSWDGKQYQLPLNDPSGKNAIHGFVCRKPWRVVAQGATDHAAWLTGEFLCSRDAPETLELWPADYRLEVTYRFAGNRLDVQAGITNPDTKDLPFGLGYHPYFALSLFGGEDAMIKAPAKRLWELSDSLPTGRRLAVDVKRDLRSPRPYASLQLDDVYGDIRSAASDDIIGSVAHKNHRLQIFASPVFRELVGFTPPHRQALCLEPYTCVTDAINLEQKGIDAGWRILKPGMTEETLLTIIYRHES